MQKEEPRSSVSLRVDGAEKPTLFLFMGLVQMRRKVKGHTSGLVKESK